MLIAGLVTLFWDLQYFSILYTFTKNAARRKLRMRLKKANSYTISMGEAERGSKNIVRGKLKLMLKKSISHKMSLAEAEQGARSPVPLMADISQPATPYNFPSETDPPVPQKINDTGFPFPDITPTSPNSERRPTLSSWQSDSLTIAPTIRESSLSPPASTHSSRPSMKRCKTEMPTQKLHEEREDKPAAVKSLARPHLARMKSDVAGGTEQRPASRFSRPPLTRWASDYSSKDKSQAHIPAENFARPNLVRWQSDFSARLSPMSPGLRPGRSEKEVGSAQGSLSLDPLSRNPQPSTSPLEITTRKVQRESTGGFPFPTMDTPAGTIAPSAVSSPQVEPQEKEEKSAIPFAEPTQPDFRNRPGLSYHRKFQSRIDLPKTPMKILQASPLSPAIVLTPSIDPLPTLSEALLPKNHQRPGSARTEKALMTAEAEATIGREDTSPEAISKEKRKQISLDEDIIVSETEKRYTIPEMSWRTGTAILASFAVIFLVAITLHSTLLAASRTFSLFSSSLLAGTIIFGGASVRLHPPPLAHETLFPHN